MRRPPAGRLPGSPQDPATLSQFARDILDAHNAVDRNSPFGSRFPTWQLGVCNYAPPGNYVGQRPY